MTATPQLLTRPRSLTTLRGKVAPTRCARAKMAVSGDTTPSQAEALSATTIVPPSTPIPADVTTVLQFRTCYIRIIHLHSILYARILDHLLAALPSRNHDSNQNTLAAS